MIIRHAKTILLQLSKTFPVVALTGPRQSGKTTLSRQVFPDKKYVSLEDLDHRAFANEDPRGFLKQSFEGMIIDEAQHSPQLFSYIQGIVDESKQMGQFVLTGSQQFGLTSGINQSLAGRVGLIELLPFSISELSGQLGDLNATLSKGFYPPIYDRKPDPRLWYEDYIRTYIERDVRNLIQVKDLSLFQKFIGLCAARTGQLVNFSELSTAAGIDVRTIKSWISVLQASYIVFLLKPYYKNFSKKLVKSPKLYFYDAGLLCNLLRIKADDIPLSPYRGAIFESMIAADVIKYNCNHRAGLDFHYWRDNKGVEVDLLFESRKGIKSIEIKSGQTVQSDHFKNLKAFESYSGTECFQSYLIYGGDQVQDRNNTKITPWAKAESIFQ